MGQGKLRVIIHVNFVELEYILLDAKFHDHTTINSVEEMLKVFPINEHGGHLGHVTCAIYINFLFHCPRRLHTQFGFDWPSGFRGCLKIMVIYMSYTCI